jgi:hypothetical protein
MIYSIKGNTKVLIPKWANKGNSTTPIYFNNEGEPTAGTSYSEYVKWNTEDAS